jgi:hypothetical protein
VNGDDQRGDEDRAARSPRRREYKSRVRSEVRWHASFRGFAFGGAACGQGLDLRFMYAGLFSLALDSCLFSSFSFSFFKKCYNDIDCCEDTYRYVLVFCHVCPLPLLSSLIHWDTCPHWTHFLCVRYRLLSPICCFSLSPLHAPLDPTGLVIRLPLDVQLT